MFYQKNTYRFIQCKFIYTWIFFVLISTHIVAQGITGYNLQDYAKSNWLEFFNRQLIPLDDKTISGISISDGKLEGGAWISGVQFSNGIIELDVRGKNVNQSSFVGICFHGVDEDTFDAIYLRPFNFLSPDTLRRSHCIQYTSYPEYTWERLRREFRGQYERAIPSPPNPDSWIHLKLILDYPIITLYIDHRPDPVMQINQLNTRRTGKIGLFVGDTSDGDFANLTLQEK